MNALDALRMARDAGVRVWIDGDDLVVEAVAAPPPKVIDLLSSHKAEILRQLRGAEYTPADLTEMDRLLTELSKLERWTIGELEQRLDERGRMAPVNVLKALYALRAARDAALAGWPENPLERAQITLCRLVN